MQQYHEKRLIILNEAQIFGKHSYFDFLCNLKKHVGLEGVFNVLVSEVKNKGLVDDYKKGKLGSDFFSIIRGILDPSSMKLSDEIVKQCWSDALKTSKTIDVAMRQLFMFLEQNINYSLLLVVTADPTTYDSFKSKLESDDIKAIFAQNRLLIVKAYEHLSLDKQKMFEDTIIKLKQRKVVFKSIFSFDPDISAKQMEKPLKAMKLLEQEVICMDVYPEQSYYNKFLGNSSNIPKLIYTAHCKANKIRVNEYYDEKQNRLKEAYTNSKTVVQYEHNLNKISYSENRLKSLVASVGKNKTSLLLLSETQLFYNAAKEMQKIQLCIGSRLLLLIHQLQIRDKHFESDTTKILFSAEKEVEKIRQAIGVLQMRLPWYNISDCWRALLKLNIEEKLRIYQFVEFMMLNNGYHLLLMSTADRYDEMEFSKGFLQPQNVEYSNLIKRINFINSDKNGRLEKVVDQFYTLLEQHNCSEIDNFVSFHRTVTASCVKNKLQKDSLAKTINFIDKTQGLKHLNNFTGGNSITMIKLLIDSDYEIAKNYLEEERSIALNKIDNYTEYMSLTDNKDIVFKDDGDEERKLSPECYQACSKKFAEPKHFKQQWHKFVTSDDIGSNTKHELSPEFNRVASAYYSNEKRDKQVCSERQHTGFVGEERKKQASNISFWSPR